MSVIGMDLSHSMVCFSTRSSVAFHVVVDDALDLELWNVPYVVSRVAQEWCIINPRRMHLRSFPLFLLHCMRIPFCQLLGQDRTRSNDGSHGRAIGWRLVDHASTHDLSRALEAPCIAISRTHPRRVRLFPLSRRNSRMSFPSSYSFFGGPGFDRCTKGKRTRTTSQSTDV